MNPLEFHWEFRQNQRLNSLLKEVDSLKRVAPPSRPKTTAESELEQLRFEVSELKLFVAVLVQILEKQGIASPGEFIETLEQIAAELRPAAKTGE